MYFTDCTLHMRYALAGVLFLAATAELVLCIYYYSYHGKIKYCLKNIIFFLLMIIFLSFITVASGYSHPLKLPWVLVLIACMLSFLHTIAEFRKEYRHCKEMLTPVSIKQALDNLKSGICFSDASGKIILINYKMRNLIYTLDGNYPQMLGEIHKALNNSAVQIKQNPMLYRFPDGKIWCFYFTDLTNTQLEGFTQATAQDVTQLYEANIKLDNANKELQQTNDKLKKMYDRLADRIREQETLNLKMRIHDNIGTSLITISDILNCKTNADMEMQLANLQDAVSYFSGDHPPLSETIEALCAKAAGMNVELELSGTMPENKTAYGLVVSAARECVTNCLNHAKGNKVFVKINKDTKAYTVTITNNGKAPDGIIAEGGGLSSLRQSIESAGGKMHISYNPCFALVFNLYTGEQ